MAQQAGLQSDLNDDQTPMTMGDRYARAQYLQRMGMTDDQIREELGAYNYVAPEAAGIGDEGDDFSYWGGSDDAASFVEALGTNLQSGFKSGVEGLAGFIDDYSDDSVAADVLGDFASSVTPSEERLERLQNRSEQTGMAGKVGDAVAAEAPVVAGTVAASAAAGAAAGSVIPGLGTGVGFLIGAGYGALRMYDQGRDNVIKGKIAAETGVEPDQVTDEQVAAYDGDLTDGEKARVALGASTGLLDAYPASRIMKALAPQKVAQIAAKSLGKEVLKGGAKAGLKEGSMELFQELSIMALTDQQVRADIAKLDDPSKYEIAKMIAETRGEEMAISFLAGFGLGGPAGAIGSSIETTAQNKQVGTLKEIANQRGVDLADMEALVKDNPEAQQALQNGGYQMNEIAMRMKAVDNQREKAQSEEERRELDEMYESLSNQLDAVTDQTFGDMGVDYQSTANLKSAADLKQKNRIDNIKAREQELELPTVGNVADNLDGIESRIDNVLRARDNRREAYDKLQDAATPKAQKKAREAYDAALEAEADERAAYTKAADPDSDPAQVKQSFLAQQAQNVKDENLAAARAAEEQAAAAEEEARYQRMLDGSKSKNDLRKKVKALTSNQAEEDAAIKAVLDKKRKERDAMLTDPSTTEADFVKKDAEIADLESKVGTPNPSKRLADRILADLKSGVIDKDPETGKLVAANPSSRGEEVVQAPSDAATQEQETSGGTDTEQAAADATPSEEPTQAKPKKEKAAAAPKPKDVSPEAKNDLQNARKLMQQDPSDLNAEAMADGAAVRALEEAGIKPTPDAVDAMLDPNVSRFDTRLRNAFKAAQKSVAEAIEPETDVDVAAGTDALPFNDRPIEEHQNAGDDIGRQFRYKTLVGVLDIQTGKPEEIRQLMREWTADREQSNKSEAVATFDADDNLITIGTNRHDNAVAIPQMDMDRVALMSHTHPDKTPMSMADVAVATRFQKPFEAVLPDGQVLLINPVEGVTPQQITDFNKELLRIAREVVRSGLDTIARARVVQQAGLEAADALGLIEYAQPMEGFNGTERNEIETIVDRLVDSVGSSDDVVDGATPTGEGGGRDGAGRTGLQSETAGAATAAGLDTSEVEGQKPAGSFNEEKADEVVNSVIDPIKNKKPTNTPTDLERAIWTGKKKVKGKVVTFGKITKPAAKRALSYLVNTVNGEGSEANTVVLQVAQYLFNDDVTPSNIIARPNAPLGPDGFKERPTPSPKWNARMNAAYQFINNVGVDQGMPFKRQKLWFKRSNGFWDTQAWHFQPNPRLQKFLELVPRDDRRFSEPMEDPSVTEEMLRHEDTNLFDPDAIDIMRPSAELMQKNVYYIDKGDLEKLTPEDMISGKKLAEEGLGREEDEVGSPIVSKDGAEGYTERQEKFLNQQKFKAEKKLAMLRNMAEVHGDNPVGYVYQVDDKGRMYAQGVFTPQTGDAFKSVLRRDTPDGPRLKDDPMIDHSASGMQMNALMTGDEIAAGWFNLGPLLDESGQVIDIDTGEPATGDRAKPLVEQADYSKRDMYKIIMSDLQAEVQADAAAGVPEAVTFNEHVFQTGKSFGKSEIKPAVIAVNYAGSVNTFIDRFDTVYKGVLQDAGIPNPEIKKIMDYMGRRGYEQMKRRAPKMMAMQEWAIRNLKRIIKYVEAESNALKDRPSMEFSVGLNGKYGALKPKVHQGVKIMADDNSLPTDAGRRVQQELDVPTRKVDEAATARSIYSQIIQGFDASVLHRALAIFSEANPDVFVTTNHDSYTVPQGYAGAMAAASRQAMKEIFEEVGDPVGRLRAEIQAYADQYGIKMPRLNDPELFNEDGSFKRGNFNLDTLDESIPTFTENAGDAPPAYTDLQGNLLPQEPRQDADGNFTGPAIARAADLIDNPLDIEGTGKRGVITVRDVGKAFDEHYLEKHGRQLDPINSEEDYQTVLAEAKEEVEVQLKRPNSGVGWYSKDVEDAVRMTAQLYPTLLTNPTHRKVYMSLASIFSSGQDPDAAWVRAAEAFDGFLVNNDRYITNRQDAATATGKGDLPRSKETGKPIGWSARNAGNVKQMEMVNWLADDLGSMDAAMDWLMNPQPREEINRVAQESGYAKAGRYKTKKEKAGPPEYGYLVFGPKLGRYAMGLNGVNIDAKDTTVDLWYMRTARRYQGRMTEGPLSAEGVVAQPRNDIERDYVFRLTGDIAEEFGITPGDAQAVLWFFEKRLFQAQGVRTNEGTNSSGARKLLAERGVDNGEGGTGSPSPSGAEPAIANGRDAGPVDAGGVSAGRDTSVQGGDRDANGNVVRQRRGDARRLSSTSDGVGYENAMRSAAQSMGPQAGQVSIVPADADVQRFMSADGLSGYALDGDNIIGVFADPSQKGSAQRIMADAIARGGRRLDGFDTYLPKIYAKNGFKAVARLPFDPRYAPTVAEGALADWDADGMEAMGRANGQTGWSEPDVVFMVYDPDNASPDTDNVIGDYDDGIAAQTDELGRIGETAEGGEGGTEQGRPAGAAGGSAIALGVDEWTGRQPDVDDKKIVDEVAFAIGDGRKSANAVMAHLRHSPLFRYDDIMNAATKRDGKDYGRAFMRAHADFTKGINALVARASRAAPSAATPFYLDMIKMQKNDHIEKAVEAIKRGNIEMSDFDMKTRMYTGSGEPDGTAGPSAVRGAAATMTIPQRRAGEPGAYSGTGGRPFTGTFALGIDAPEGFAPLPSARKTFLDGVKTATKKFTHDPKGEFGEVLNQIGSLGAKTEQMLVNRFSPVRTLEKALNDGELKMGAESAFKAAEMAVNDSGRTEALLFYGAAKLGRHGEFQVKEGTVGLRTILDKVVEGKTGADRGQAMSDWMGWMAARRIKELQRKNPDLKFPMKDLEAALAKEQPQFSEAADMWRDHNNANIDFLVDTGRIQKSQADALKQDEFYVPLYRSEETAEGSPELVLPEKYGMKSPKGEVMARDPRIKKLIGGDKMLIDNLITNMIKNSEAMVAAGMRNDAANKIFDLMSEAGLAKTKKISSKKPSANAVRMWKDGKEKWVVPQGEGAAPLMVAMTGLSPLQLGAFGKLFAGIGGIFRQGVTLSPAFIIRNAIRGSVSAGILTSGANLTLRNNFFTGVTESYRNSDATRAFKAQSGMGDFRFGNPTAGFGENDILVDYGLGNKGIGYRVRQAVDALEGVGMATELAERVAAYNTMIENGVRADEAAYRALNIINYGRKGASSELRAFLPMVPFLNARIQGLARLLEGATSGDPEMRRTAFKQLMLNGLVLSAISAAIWGLNSLDEEKEERYKAEPLHRRLNYHIVYAGDKTILIPKAFEIGHLFSSLPELFGDAMLRDMNELPQGVKKMAADTLFFNAIPQAVLPIIEGKANYSFFTQRPIEGMRENNLRAEDRLGDSSALSQFVGRQLGISNLTGLSPAMIEHYMQGYGGSYFLSLASLTDIVATETGLVPAKAGGAFGATPVVSNAMQRVLGSMFKDQSDYSTRYVADFYETKDYITQIHRSAKAAADAGNVEYANKLMASAPATPRAYKIMNKASSQLSKINAAIREVSANPSMSAAEKQRKLRELIPMRNRLASSVVEIIRDLEEKQGKAFKDAA